MLNDFDEEVLTIAMRRVVAWEQLNDPKYCGSLGMVEFEALLKRAGYAPAEAHKLAMERGWLRLQAGVKL